MIFIKINDFLSKIGPIRALWAHMGPNSDRAPTRTGPQPGPGLGFKRCAANCDYRSFLSVEWPASVVCS